MSFISEYADEFRELPIRKTKTCPPEHRWAKLEGRWYDPKKGKEQKEQTEDEIKEFIKKTMKGLRGQTAYYNEFCAHLDPAFRTRPFVPRPKKKRSGKVEKKEEEESQAQLFPKLAIKDTELMKVAKELYERDMNEPTLEPLPTHFRILGYVRPCLYKTGLSEYQTGIGRVAYELVRDDRIPKFEASNGGRPKWGYPPEGTRQPELDGIPLDGERLY